MSHTHYCAIRDNYGCTCHLPGCLAGHGAYAGNDGPACTCDRIASDHASASYAAVRGILGGLSVEGLSALVEWVTLEVAIRERQQREAASGAKPVADAEEQRQQPRDSSRWCLLCDRWHRSDRTCDYISAK